MSIEYDLEMETHQEPKVLLSRIAEITGMPYVHGNTLRDEESHLVIGVYSMEDEWCIEETQQDFEFRPKTNVYFTQGKVKYERNNLLMMSTVVELLKEVRGNAVLIFSESPGVVLQKIDNVITVDPEWKDEPGMELLAKNGVDYKLEELIKL